MLQVVEAIDGPITLNICVQNPERCPYSTNCTLRAVWCDAHAALVSRLRQTTFDQLMPIEMAPA